MIEQMVRNGVMALDFPAVFGEGLWQELNESIEAFKASESFVRQKARFLSAPSQQGDKSFLIRLRPEVDTIWHRVAEHPKLLNLARAYFDGGDPLLADCDVWHTEPMPEGRERSMSQNWHVDMEAERHARRIFKAFLYFNDIGHGNGPLELWMAGSSLQENGQVSVCVPRGTMVLVDTGALLHRGGYCETGPRTLGLWYYTNGSEMRVPPLVYGRAAA